MRAHLQILAMAVGLAACTPTEDETASEPAGEGSATAEAPEAAPAPDEFAGTAWRAVSEDGARFTTMLDPDGSYRDLRNGDAWGEGEWTYADGPGGKQLCLRPDDENGVERCWAPGRMRDDTLIMTGPEDRRIELTRAEYQPAPDEESAAEE